MNKVILRGRLTRDPEIMRSAEGKMVGRYTLAVDRAYKRNGEPETDFFPCVCFGAIAQVAEKHLSKGRDIIVSGNLQNDIYEKDGERRTITKIIVESQEFLPHKRQQAGMDSQNVAAQNAVQRPQNGSFNSRPTGDPQNNVPTYAPPSYPQFSSQEGFMPASNLDPPF